MTPGAPRLDIDFVRAQFPAFSEPALRNVAFFENAGGSYACRYVSWRLNRFYKERKVQPYGPFEASRLAGEEMDNARWRLAMLLGVQQSEVVFGPSTTANVYVLANAFREWLQPGDAIVVSQQDHEANAGAWRRLAEYGIEVREWAIDPDSGSLAIEDLAQLLDETVRLVCFPHCSNVVGEINPVRRISDMVHAVGAVVCVDGVSYAPHGLPIVRKLGADIYLFSTYKTYGPHQGIMVIREDLGMALPSQGHFFNADTPSERFSPAGPDHAQVAACAGIADYIDALYDHHFKAGRDGVGRGEQVANLMVEHETRLLQPLLDALTEIPGIRLLGPARADQRAPTVAIQVPGRAEDMAAKFAAYGIMCGGGDFYAVRPLSAMGVPLDLGVLRFSFVHYTTEAEVDRLINALDHLLG